MVRIVVWAIAAILAVTAGAVWFSVPRPGNEPEAAAVDLTGPPEIGGEFSLIGHDGRRRTWADFRGKATAVFFGFTHCPDICPTTLASLSVLLADLGAAGDRLNVVLMTVDPERDTPEVLADYMASFDPRILALTGSEEEVAKATKAFKAFRQKVPLGENDYSYDHTAAVYLFRPDGGFAGTLDRHDKPEDQIAKVRRLIAA